MDHAGRLRRLQALLSGHKLDSLLVVHLPNVRYLCGFTGSAAALLVAERGSILFTDGRYRTQAKEEIKDAHVNKVSIVIARKSPPWRLRSGWPRSAERAPPAWVGIEPESITAGMRDRLASVLKGKARLRSAPPLVERARMVKDAAEILRIRRAVELGASLFQVARNKIRPGVCEVEVAAAMEYKARCAGAEGMSFPTILASGARSAIVHGRASGARIPRRGFVVCDFGVILAGYCSDRTRTVHVGRPSAEARGLYEAVLEAQQAAICGGSSGRDGRRSRWRRAARASPAETGPVLHPFDRAWFRIRDTRSTQVGGGAKPDTGSREWSLPLSRARMFLGSGVCGSKMWWWLRLRAAKC